MHERAQFQNGLQMLAGCRVVPHPLARDVRDEWKVVRHPTPKKRRQWRVVKHHIDRPGCYQVGDTFYMHPDLVEKLRLATVPSSAKNVHGALTVEGEDATEWLALRTWTARWSDNAGPLIVKWKTERMTQQLGDEKPWPAIETDSRQLFRCMTETPNV